MVKAEGKFKNEIREAFFALLGDNTPLISMSDKFTVGLSDLLLIYDRTYTMELKYVSKMPVRKTTNLLKHPFSPRQIRFLQQTHSQYCGVGLGVIGLPEGDAMIVPAPALNHFHKGNLTKEEAELLYRNNPSLVMKKNGKHWDIKKILEYSDG